MKKFFILSALSCSMLYLPAQYKSSARQSSGGAHPVHASLPKMHGQSVTDKTIQQFKLDFGDVTVRSWKHGDWFDEAVFVKNGVETTAFYDVDSKLVGTTSSKKMADLPAKVNSYILKKYPGYTVKDIILFDDNEENETDMVLYDQQFQDADNYFIELQKGNDKLVLTSSLSGEVSFFTRLH